MILASPNDTWAHRSMHMRCVTCMWWVTKSGTVLGRCRRHAPTLGGWPAVMFSDWCGDHKLNEQGMDSLSASPKIDTQEPTT